MAKIFDKVSQSFLDAIKSVMTNESTDAYGKSMDKIKDDEKKKNISGSDMDKISKLHAMLAKEKKPVKEAKGDVTVKTKTAAEVFAQRTAQAKNKVSVPKDPKTGKTLYQKVTSEEQIDEATAADLDKQISFHQGGLGKGGKASDAYHRQALKKLIQKRKELDEEVEKIDELSKDTVQKYKKAAVKDYYDADDVDDGRRVGQRYRGIKMANRKLAKEEAEQIDELSKGKLATYINKAEDSADDLERKAIKGDDKSWRKMHKRLDSTLKAKHKWITAKEEIDPDLENELKATRQTKKSVEDAKKKYGVKKESVQIDEISTKLATDYSAKASDARGHKGMPTKKVDNRYAGVALASKKMSGKAKVNTTESQETNEVALPWKEDPKNPSHKMGARKDRYGNVVKNVAKHLAKNAMAKAAAQKDYKPDPNKEAAARKNFFEEEGLEEAYGMWKVEFPKQHVGKQVEAGSVHVKAQNVAHAHKVAAKRVGVDHKVFKTKVTKSSILPEEAEQIDEISKKTLGSYVKKAAGHAAGSAAATAAIASSSNPKVPEKVKRDLRNRLTGISKATDRLTKEEAEQIDELSKSTLGSYINKAKNQIDAASWRTGYRQGSKPSTSATDPIVAAKEKQLTKRHKGIETAVSKLAKEDQDFIDSINDMMFDEIAIAEARGRPKKAAAKDYTIHPKTKEKLMHNNPEHMKKIELLQKNGILPKPKTEAAQHIMNQLQKAKTSMTGGSVIHFTHGESKHVSGTHAAKLLDKYASLRPNEKEDFQKKVGHSHEQLMKHV